MSDNPLFAHTSIDFDGPLIIYQCEDDVNGLKVYNICLFTCASTQAIHLRSLNVEQFLLALREDLLVAGGSQQLCIWSDNAKLSSQQPRNCKG